MMIKPSSESKEFLGLVTRSTIVGMVIGGWIGNIVKLTGHDFSVPVTVEITLRIVGIVFLPLGAIMGYL